MESKIEEHSALKKRYIKYMFVSTLFGATLSAAVSLYLGLFTLYESYELDHKSKYADGLLWDIDRLQRIQDEIKSNTNILLNNSFETEIPVKEYLIPTDFEDPELNKLIKWYINTVGADKILRVEKISLPKVRLYDSEQYLVYNFNVSSDIDFELRKDLKEHYRKIERINKSLDLIKYKIAEHNRTLTYYLKHEIDEEIVDIDVSVEFLTDQRIVDLGARVQKEIAVLRARYDETK